MKILTDDLSNGENGWTKEPAVDQLQVGSDVRVKRGSAQTLAIEDGLNAQALDVVRKKDGANFDKISIGPFSYWNGVFSWSGGTNQARDLVLGTILPGNGTNSSVVMAPGCGLGADNHTWQFTYESHLENWNGVGNLYVGGFALAQKFGMGDVTARKALATPDTWIERVAPGVVGLPSVQATAVDAVGYAVGGVDGVTFEGSPTHIKIVNGLIVEAW